MLKAPAHYTLSSEISITASASFVKECSNPEENFFMWICCISFANESSEPITLTKRFWTLVDAHGQMHNLEGEGVSGEQPTLLPHEPFKYISGAPLRTPSGMMTGYYAFQTRDGHMQYAPIPAMALESPYHEPIVH